MDLLNGKIKPIYFKYLAAAAGSAVIGAFFGMIDAMVVGKYHGPIGNAALAGFSPLWSIIFCLGFLAGIGGSVLFANYRGEKDEKTALLLALKPYMSPERCDAIDKLIMFGRISEVNKQLR